MSEENANVSYYPTDGLSYDPTDSRYWDPQMLSKEIERVFEVCHGCRMCFKFCDSFPNLFSLLDNQYDGDVRRITPADTQNVMDACFQCKLCEVQCPYTPRDEHEFQLDFPKLVHRFKAIQAKGKVKPLRDRVLGDPDSSAQLARASFGMANVMNRVKAHRLFMEKFLGIHRDKLLPDFSASTFEKWASTQGKIKESENSETVLFQTCYVQHNEPQIGRDTLEVLEQNKVECACVKGLKCCGMPAWEQGDLESLRRHAKHNLDCLMPFVENGSKVLAINPTCAMMMRQEYPELLEGEDRQRAVKLAEAVNDPSEYLWNIRNESRFNPNIKSKPDESISYHAPCHLRAQRVGFKGRDLIKKILGAPIKTVMECCGHDGTYAMKVESFEASKRIGQKAFSAMQKNAPIWSTDCPLAALQFEQHAGIKPMHPMSILAKAYRSDGFPNKVIEAEPPNEKKE
ncbi:MAG: 4Fe-4S dicluster domain-containing protein [SAR324 cluster bacterium]|nr:4Fe-4S dicluster domain-containing protein [SAR324 cluster bacterium]